MNTDPGWVTNSISAAPVAALRRTTEVLRIIREPFRLHLRPTMDLDRLECRLSGTRHRALAGSHWSREWMQPGTSTPWSQPAPPLAQTGRCLPKYAPSRRSGHDTRPR